MMMEDQQQFISDLFRQEFSRIVAVISSKFGLQNLETAEDIASDTFLAAQESWSVRGVPDNPAAWLYVVAKQKMLLQFRREKIYDEKVIPQIKNTTAQTAGMDDPDFSEQHIQDSQLQMIFAVCEPSIASEAQIALALRILCGFGIDEIATAFLASKETINKRLFRAKEKLKKENQRLAMPPEHLIGQRLGNVLHVIYLLFSEGYYSSIHDQTLRKDLCLEAIHLGISLIAYDKTNTPEANALMALMCFHASRFDARQSLPGEPLLYEQQDPALWDRQMIDKGIFFLDQAAAGTELSSYHLEAGIAYWNTQKEDTPEKWEHILHHYDLLLKLNYSPVVALNRIYALYKTKDREQALTEAGELNWTTNHFYFVLLGELYSGINLPEARKQYERALALAKTDSEQQSIRKKIELIDQK